MRKKKIERHTKFETAGHYEVTLSDLLLLPKRGAFQSSLEGKGERLWLWYCMVLFVRINQLTSY